MEQQELLPYLNKFITVILDDGSEHSGYVANYDEIKNSDKADANLRLVNGLYTEDITIDKILSVMQTSREDTVSIPVIDLKKGYFADGSSKK